MLKFFSRSFSKRTNQRTPDGLAQPESKVSSANVFEFHVQLLDGEKQKFHLPKRTLGSELFDRVCFNLEIEERDFFGLQYVDSDNISHWLEMNKKIKKQVDLGKNVLCLQFRVKFFPSQPHTLKEERTKYYFYWQIKQDIANGILDVPPDLMVELAALTVQSELGDFEAGYHDPGTVSEFRFIPDHSQTERFELDVFMAWVRLRSLNPAQCEERYINKVKDLEMYGVSMHEVLGKDGNTYKLGLTPFGMLIYDGEERIGLFLWQKMEKLAFNKKQLVIQVIDVDSSGSEKLHMFQFTLRSSKACKHLWKCAIEFHSFYRLQHNTSLRSRQSFVRMQSKFRYSGKTEAQLRASSRAPQPRRQITFQRRPSKRYSRREPNPRVRERFAHSHSSRNLSHTDSIDGGLETAGSSSNVNKSYKVSTVSQMSLNALQLTDSSKLNLIEFSPASPDSNKSFEKIPATHSSNSHSSTYNGAPPAIKHSQGFTDVISPRAIPQRPPPPSSANVPLGVNDSFLTGSTDSSGNRSNLQLDLRSDRMRDPNRSTSSSTTAVGKNTSTETTESSMDFRSADANGIEILRKRSSDRQFPSSVYSNSGMSDPQHTNTSAQLSKSWCSERFASGGARNNLASPDISQNSPSTSQNMKITQV